MKKNYTMTVLMLLLVSGNLLAQQIYVNQVFIGTGGIYGNTSDHVTITSYNPETQNSVLVGEIMRESIQDIFLYLNCIFVAAEDSIVKYDATTFEKLAVAYESNLSRLYFNGENLFVSRRGDLNGPPPDGIYLKVYDGEYLNLMANIEGISADAADMEIVSDTLYVAIPGDWQATEGKLAIIDLQSMQLKEEVNLGADAVGINDLYEHQFKIYSVNRSPYNATTGSVTTYNTSNSEFSTTVINHIVGKGIALDPVSFQTLYLLLDYGIGSYDVTTNEVIETSIVPDPGSSAFIFIAAADYDYTNDIFYVTVTDYYSMGEGRIYDMTGTVTGSFDAGISAECVVIDYDVSTYVLEQNNAPALLIYPNPTSEYVMIKSKSINLVRLINSTGIVIFETKYNSENDVTIDVNGLASGLYFVNAETSDGLMIGKFIVQ